TTLERNSTYYEMKKHMNKAVIHSDIMVKDDYKLRSYYSQLFCWKIDADNPMNYGIVSRDENVNSEGIGIGGGVGAMPEGAPGHVTIYVEAPDVEASLAKAGSLGGRGLMGSAHGPVGA